MATLPVANRTWVVTPNVVNQGALGTNPLTTKRVKRLVKDALKANGWPIGYSCDSVAAGTVGDGIDRIDADADIVGAAPGNPHSWWLHLPPSGSGLGQILVDNDSTADSGGASGSMYWSPAAGFTGGSTTARPTATDEQEISSTTNLYATSNGDYNVHLWTCTDPGREAVRLAVICSATAAGPVALFSLEKASSAPAAWSPPVLAIWAGGASAFGDRTVWTGTGWQARVGVNNRQVLAIGDTAPIANDLDGDVLVVPAGLNQATDGRLGFADDFHFIRDTFTSYDTLSDTRGTLGWIALDEVVWPWDHVTVSGANAAGAKLLVNYTNNADSRLISAVPAVGAELGATFDIGRWTKIVLTITVPTGFSPHATVLMAGHSIWHTAYDGAVDDFSPLFKPFSTIQVTNGQAVISLLPIGGWWGAPTVEPGVFKEAV